MVEPLFPILGEKMRGHNVIHEWRRRGCFAVVSGIPWAVILPHEKQAQENHGQTLLRLAERGGLSHCEAVAIIENRKWRAMNDAEANDRLLALITEATPHHPQDAAPSRPTAA